MAPALALYTALSVPPLPRATVTALARVSPAGKLIVEVEPPAAGASTTKPPLVWPVTVRLPVTATALVGMGVPSATVKVRAVLAWNTPLSPTLLRLSRTRAGSRAWTASRRCSG